MRLCLVSPSMTVPRRDWHYPQAPPLGLAYLAAMARTAGHAVTVVDALGEALDDYHEFIHDSFVNGLPIEEVVRRVNPDAQVIGVGTRDSSGNVKSVSVFLLTYVGQMPEPEVHLLT